MGGEDDDDEEEEEDGDDFYHFLTLLLGSKVKTAPHFGLFTRSMPSFRHLSTHSPFISGEVVLVTFFRTNDRNFFCWKKMEQE